jgi:hypothetical protein
MAAILASLLEDFSPAPKGEPAGIEILRAVKHSAEAEPVQPPPPADRQAELIRSIEGRVRAEEREAAQKRLEEAIAAEKTRHEDELKDQRVIWVEQESSQISAQIVECIGRIETILSERVANILKPFVSAGFRQQSIAEFEEVLTTILLGDEAGLIRIVGPEDIIQALKDKLGSHRGAIEFLPGDHIEVSVTARNTTVQTQLGQWADRLEQALKARS